MGKHKQHNTGNGGTGAHLAVVVALALPCLALQATGARAEPASDAPASPAAQTPQSRRGPFAAAPWARVDACYREHAAAYPDLSVNTTASFFARGNKLVFVRVDLPEAPGLARCLEREFETWTLSDRPPGLRDDDLCVGAFTVELGPVRRAPKFKSEAEIRERMRRMTEEALARGVLREGDPVVQEQRRRELTRTPAK